MRLPTSFQLINRKFSVEAMDADVANIAEVKGTCNSGEGRILVNLDNDNREDVEHTFYHELFHALFDSAGRPDLSKDEDLVDLMGALLHQYLQTEKGNLQA